MTISFMCGIVEPMNTEIDKNGLVVKANKVIEASYKLTALEQKLILVAVSLIEPGVYQETYSIQVADLNKAMGIEYRAAYTELREITKNILKKPVEIQEGNGVLQINWFSHVRYEKGVIEFSFHKAMMPYLWGLKKLFTKYQLWNVLSMDSKYSIRFYELLKQYESIGNRTFTVDDLRRKIGIEPDLYKAYYDFKRWVIHPAKKELQKKSDIAFDIFEMKTGRRIDKITFLIQKNTPEEPGGQMKKRKRKLTEEEIEKAKTGFLESIKDNNFLMNRFKKGGFDNVTIRMNFEGYLSNV